MCLVVIILGTFSEALGLGLIMPLVSTVVGGSSDVGVAVYFNQYFGELSLANIAWVILALFGMKFLLSVYKNYLMYGLEWRARGFWMASIYKLMMFQEYGKFEHEKPGFVVNSITNETYKAASAFRQILEYIAQVMQVLALSTVLLISNFVYSAIALSAVAVMLFIIKYLVVNKTRGYSQQRQEYEEVVTHEVNEMIQGMLTIRALLLERHFLDKFRSGINRLVLLMRRTEVLKRLPLQVVEILVVSLIVLLIIIGEMMQIDMSAQLPFFGVMFVVSLRLFSNAGSLATNYMSINVLWASVVKVADYLAHPLLADQDNEREDESRSKVSNIDEIRFDDVSFGYSAEVPVVEHMNLYFKKNSITSIIGESGSGKSTIGKLLLQFYCPSSGQITVNGSPIVGIGNTDWRRLVSYVDQNYFFFYGTILENLVVGQTEFSLEEIDRVLEITHVKSFVYEFPEGLDTCIGDKGNLLSGGQKARLALARAMLRAPSVLVLDEITSALDAVTKEIIAEALVKLSETMTIVVISHDEIMINKANSIYRVEAGCVHAVT